MAKLIDLQVEKVRNLVAGMRKNEQRLSARGISLDNLELLTTEATKVEESSKKCEALRAECSAQVKQTNELLAVLKQTYAQYRIAIRTNFPQEQWSEFGLMDKR